jgi:hypothetical protein
MKGTSQNYSIPPLYDNDSNELIYDDNIKANLFCDISKAFDRGGLIKKLKSYGISGDLLIWFNNYLSGRRQFVFVNNELSDSGLVKADVPQDLYLVLYYYYYILMTLQIT